VLAVLPLLHAMLREGTGHESDQVKGVDTADPQLLPTRRVYSTEPGTSRQDNSFFKQNEKTQMHEVLQSISITLRLPALYRYLFNLIWIRIQNFNKKRKFDAKQILLCIKMN
jgi:hypothetical protein